ncbi:MAG TPA: hypothetical protein VGM67_04850 [Gemmatimonadaceae bacterium]|jgi:hypothetical protein
MGITIHYTLYLREENAIHGLVHTASTFAAQHAWPWREIQRENAVLERGPKPGDFRYEGSSYGIEITPNDRCEPLRLEFGVDGFAADYTKTQFAGPVVHREIVALLDALNPFLLELEVIDEGEYWETRDETLLAQNFEECAAAIHQALAENPRARGPVRLPSGRWVDVIS